MKKFLKQNGLKKVPGGYEVDHIRPLSEGGTDTPDNMQLIPKSYHKIKTANERSNHKKIKVYKKSKVKYLTDYTPNTTKVKKHKSKKTKKHKY